MRLIFAALLGAVASLPTLVHATTTPPDPADPAASVPAISVPSAFAGYRRYKDADNPTWQQLNQAVQDKPRMRGMTRGGAMSQPTGSNTSNHAQHEETAQ